jgi:hypothetical protein
LSGFPNCRGRVLIVDDLVSAVNLAIAAHQMKRTG